MRLSGLCLGKWWGVEEIKERSARSLTRRLPERARYLSPTGIENSLTGRCLNAARAVVCQQSTPEELNAAVESASKAFETWKSTPVTVRLLQSRTYLNELPSRPTCGLHLGVPSF